uniref:Cation efflux protein n=1 Tax=Clostridioides difficile TaxID=1496 RepID=A0A381KN35_CLODI|nr:cation efflux protein [Clostridioides difficile]
METRYEEANKITIQSILWNVVLTIIKGYSWCYW